MIVVVDDTAMVLKSVSSMLTRSGYEVHAAGSTDAAGEAAPYSSTSCRNFVLFTWRAITTTTLRWRTNV